MIKVVEVDLASNSRALNSIVQMHLECFRASELHPDQFSKGYWWIAFDGGEPVGFAGITQSVRWGDAGYLCRSGVVEGVRGQGLQKRLIAARLAKARRVGWNWVITDTRRNPASANSLINCGFKMYQPAVPWGMKDACYWRKRVAHG